MKNVNILKLEGAGTSDEQKSFFTRNSGHNT